MDNILVHVDYNTLFTVGIGHGMKIGFTVILLAYGLSYVFRLFKI